MDLKLKGKRALITGATRGMGRAIAETRLGADGWRLPRQTGSRQGQGGVTIRKGDRGRRTVTAVDTPSKIKAANRGHRLKRSLETTTDQQSE